MSETIDLASMSIDEKRSLLVQLALDRARRSAPAYPLSYGQRSMWYLYQVAPGSPAYITTYAGEIVSDVDVQALERAIAGLVQRHGILRTTYAVRDGQPVQLLHPSWPLNLVRRSVEPDEFDRWLRRECSRPFDLESAPGIRFTLVKRADVTAIVVAAHHITGDTWSMDVLLDDLLHLYSIETGQRTGDLPIAQQYVAYTQWQLEMLASMEGERLWQYWSRQLDAEAPPIRLPIDRPRQANQSYRGDVYSFTIGRQLTAKLKDVGRTAGATPFMTLFAAYVTLLHRYSGQEDLFVGAPFSCRDQSGISDLVGYIANTLVLRCDMSGDPSFTQLLSRVKKTVLEAIEHQDYPFALLVERLQPARDRSFAPLFQASCVWEQVSRTHGLGAKGAPGSRSTGLDINTIYVGQGGAPSDLMLMMGELDGEFFFRIQYSTDLFDDTTIARMAGHLKTLLGGIAEAPERLLSQLPMLTQSELDEQLTWNQTSIDYDKSSSVPEMIAEVAARYPDRVAMRFNGQNTTYGDLALRVHELAQQLQLHGVQADVIVPVLMSRSDEQVIAALAVMAAGGAYMPVDPTQPANRINTMLERAGDLPIILTIRPHQELARQFRGHAFYLDERIESVSTEARADGTAIDDNLAYVIHTSGSTGIPKGTLNVHAGLRNKLQWMQQNYQLTVEDRVLYKAPVSFDASIAEMFWPLTVGAQLIIADPDGHKDTKYLLRIMAEESVTVAVYVVPSMLRVLLADPDIRKCGALRLIITAGEVVPYDLVQRCLATLDADLWSEYGPTETAVAVTAFRCTRGMSGPTVPIGRPIANVRAHILDAHRNPVPVGVPAELHIGGVAVGRGYLNQPEETSARYVADPFYADGTAMLYRTGDLARYLPDGNIDFLGRIDGQVKIHGVRIEPSEVDVAIEKHPKVLQSAVIAMPDERGNTQLVAYVVAAQGEMAPSSGELRGFLLEHLPAAMVPTVFDIREELPLTSSGKIDRKTLLKQQSVVQIPEFVEPRNDIEKMLAKIWCEVLDLERVGIHDDFFALGGSSSHSLEVTTKARDAGIALTPEALLVCSTIAELTVKHNVDHGHDLDEERPNPRADDTAPKTSDSAKRGA